MPSMLTTLLLCESLETVRKEGDWITVDGRHIFIANKDTADKSKAAFSASEKANKTPSASNLFSASNDHYAAYRALKEAAGKNKGAEQKSLQGQADRHFKIGTELQSRAMSVPSKPQRESRDTRPELKGPDKELMNQAAKIGTKMYGKDSSGLIIDTKTIERGSVKQYLQGGDGGTRYDTFDYVFKPSTGKGYNLADKPIRASHADVDGKIYVAGSEGVFVINSTKGLPK